MDALSKCDSVLILSYYRISLNYALSPGEFLVYLCVSGQYSAIFINCRLIDIFLFAYSLDSSRALQFSCKLVWPIRLIAYSISVTC
jgi:hypothetical protein